MIFRFDFLGGTVIAELLGYGKTVRHVRAIHKGQVEQESEHTGNQDRGRLPYFKEVKRKEDESCSTCACSHLYAVLK